MLEFPTEFKSQMVKLLAEESSDFFEALQRDRSTSIRYNPTKEKPELSVKKSRVAWTSQGVYLNPRPSFTLDPYFHAGHYYVQDASSMILEQVYKQAFTDIQAPVILDLCAAPGGKSTHLLSMMDGKGILVANEVNATRVKILQDNLAKWGFPNFIVSQNDPSAFSDLAETFDLILIDAPCSGEGLFRKDNKAIGEWSLSNVQLCSLRQKRISAEAVKALKPGGYLIYSTCTYNQIENEQIVHWLEQEFNLEPQALEMDSFPGLHYNDGVYKCFPHKLEGEGFSISLLHKKGENESQSKKHRRSVTSALVASKTRKHIESFLQLGSGDTMLSYKEWIHSFPEESLQLLSLAQTYLRIQNFGIRMGSFKGTEFIPAHGLSQSRFVSHNFPIIQLNREEAINYLRGHILEGFIDKRGWHEMRYESARLGWGKALAKRVNNNYPKNLRIRK